MKDYQINENIFNNPQYFRNLILNNLKVNFVKENFSGKGIACVFLTRFCPVSCEFCFFKSLPQNSVKTEKDAFNQIGINNLISFINSANLAYLLISGGGDPFTEFNSILRLIKETNVNKIVLVTSGFWAINEEKTLEYLDKIYKQIKDKEVILRLSYDEHHVNKLSDKNIYHIISIFEKNFPLSKNFKLRIHTMIDDKEIDKFLKNIEGKIKYKKKIISNSDSNIVSKINPYDYKIILNNNFSFEIGFSYRFYPDPKINLNNNDIIKRNLNVFEKDLKNSQNYNSAIAFNNDSSKGLDFWINYNGNVCTWGNQVPDNVQNIYFDDYNEVISKTFSDPIMASYLIKGSLYRYNILNEISHKTVLKSKLINIRDYVGSILFEEDKIRLYYTIRVLQDFFKDNILKDRDLIKLPKNLQNTIKFDKNYLINLYNNSNYTIIDQFLSKKQSKEEAIELLELIKLNHYDVNKEKILSFIHKINNMYDLNISNINDVISLEINPYNERLIPTR
ncbi:MAG: 4Fe-4S cluster-binding domain-containing protein [Alphaproteobacteria bacterium]